MLPHRLKQVATKPVPHMDVYCYILYRDCTTTSSDSLLLVWSWWSLLLLLDMFSLTIVVLLFLTTATGSVRTVIVFDNGCGSSQTMHRTLLCQDRVLEEGCVHLNSMYRRQNNATVVDSR